MTESLLLLLGLILLLYGGHYLVKGGVKLSVTLGISPMIIGLTILAFGTSAPELLVSVIAALSGSPDISVGNVVGSNIANIWLVLGGTALIAPLCCGQALLPRNSFYMIFITIGFIIMCFISPLTLWHGLFLCAFLALFLYDCFRRAKETNDPSALLGDEAEEILEQVENPNAPIGTALLLSLLGLVGLGIGSELTVNNAVLIAKDLGITEAVISATIIAIGTSLPELAAAGMAAWHGHTDMAIGNSVGSNIFNIAAVLGITSLITPIPIAATFLSFDVWVVLAAALCLVPFILFKKPITRPVGILFLCLYGLYIAKITDFLPIG